MRSLMEKWTTDVCLNIQKILELSKDQQRYMSVTGLALVGCGKFQDRILGPKPKKMPGRPRKKKETRHNKKGCKKDPIADVPKEKKKAGRQKKIPNTENLEKDNDVLAFVKTDINKFEMGNSNSRVVFNDGSVINVGKFNSNKKRMFGSSNTGHVKMR
ncbi:hypothetical protein Tco_0775801 [Tanacetum coccineum]